MKVLQQIAKILNLGVSTVEADRGQIMEKLNPHSTEDFVRFAVR